MQGFLFNIFLLNCFNFLFEKVKVCYIITVNMNKNNKNLKNNFVSFGVVAENRKARFNYEVFDTIEAGVVLNGTEVKSLRLKRCNIKDGFAAPKNNEMFLYKVSIQPYEFAAGNNNKNHEEYAERKLLLHKNQIAKLIGYFNDNQTTIVPLKVYFNDKGKAKVLLGLARGKKLYDKRETIKKRDILRDNSRYLKNIR